MGEQSRLGYENRVWTDIDIAAIAVAHRYISYTCMARIFRVSRAAIAGVVYRRVLHPVQLADRWKVQRRPKRGTSDNRLIEKWKKK